MAVNKSVWNYRKYEFIPKWIIYARFALVPKPHAFKLQTDLKSNEGDLKSSFSWPIWICV